MSNPARQSRSSGQKRSASGGRAGASGQKRSASGGHSGASGQKRSGVRGKHAPSVKTPGLKQDPAFSSAARRALAVRRFWLVLLTVVLLTVGLLSACGVRLF